MVSTDDKAEDISVKLSATAITIKYGDGLAAAASGTNFCSGTGTQNNLLLGLTTVVIKGADASGQVDVGFDLEGPTDNRLANWSNLTFTVQVDGALVFDGSYIGSALAPVRATVTEEDFTVGTLHGSYYAGTEIVFWGTEGGNDTFDASAVETTDVYAYGGNGNDVLKGGDGDDELIGGDATDDGNDRLYGGDGDDILSTRDTGDYNSVAADLNTDQAWGGPGDDQITVDAADTAAPGDGEDTIEGTDSAYGSGSDKYIGTLYYGDSSAAISVDVDLYEGVVNSSAGDDYYGDVVLVFVGSPFADTMSGRDASDADGDFADPGDRDGIDIFDGGEGADTLLGFGEGDVLIGGGGADVIKGGAGDDDLAGSSGADRINGGTGDDLINGGGGDDIMYGSLGDDHVLGNKGSDQAWGGLGRDDICAAEVTNGCEFKK